MSKIRYTKYIPNPADAIDLEELLDQLKEFFLESGFSSQYRSTTEHAQNLQNLYQALAEILSESEQLSQEWRESLDKYSKQFPYGTLPDDLKELLDQLHTRRRVLATPVVAVRKVKRIDVPLCRVVFLLNDFL